MIDMETISLKCFNNKKLFKLKMWNVGKNHSV